MHFTVQTMTANKYSIDLDETTDTVNDIINYVRTNEWEYLLETLGMQLAGAGLAPAAVNQINDLIRQTPENILNILKEAGFSYFLNDQIRDDLRKISDKSLASTEYLLASRELQEELRIMGIASPVIQKIVDALTNGQQNLEHILLEHNICYDENIISLMMSLPSVTLYDKAADSGRPKRLANDMPIGQILAPDALWSWNKQPVVLLDVDATLVNLGTGQYNDHLITILKCFGIYKVSLLTRMNFEDSLSLNGILRCDVIRRLEKHGIRVEHVFTPLDVQAINSRKENRRGKAFSAGDVYELYMKTLEFRIAVLKETNYFGATDMVKGKNESNENFAERKKSEIMRRFKKFRDAFLSDDPNTRTLLSTLSAFEQKAITDVMYEYKTYLTWLDSIKKSDQTQYPGKDGAVTKGCVYEKISYMKNANFIFVDDSAIERTSDKFDDRVLVLAPPQMDGHFHTIPPYMPVNDFIDQLAKKLNFSPKIDPSLFNTPKSMPVENSTTVDVDEDEDNSDNIHINPMLFALNNKINQLYKMTGIDSSYQHLTIAVAELQQVFDLKINSSRIASLSKSEKVILDKTVKFLGDFLDDNIDTKQKIKIIHDYEKTIYPYRGLKTICASIGVIIVGALCAATGAAFGLGIGALAGAWSGPGAIVTAFAGMFSGAATAWTVGVAAGAAVAGVTGLTIASYYAFFKPEPLQQAINGVVETANRLCVV